MVKKKNKKTTHSTGQRPFKRAFATQSVWNKHIQKELHSLATSEEVCYCASCSPDVLLDQRGTSPCSPSQFKLQPWKSEWPESNAGFTTEWVLPPNCRSYSSPSPTIPKSLSTASKESKAGKCTTLVFVFTETQNNAQITSSNTEKCHSTGPLCSNRWTS